MTNITNGGARKKEWHCILENRKPMYVNTRTNEKYPVFVNKNGRPTFRNTKGIALEAKDCAANVITALKGRDEKAVLESNQRKNQTSKKGNPKIKKTKKIIVIHKKKTHKSKIPKPNTIPASVMPSPSPYVRSVSKQRCDNGQRCKKGTRCNKKIGYCEPSGTKKSIGANKTVKRKETAMTKMKTLAPTPAVQEELKEFGLEIDDFSEDVCIVLKNIRKKAHISGGKQKEEEWSRKKIEKLHKIVPKTSDKNGNLLKGFNVSRDQYLNGKLIQFSNILGKGGFGKIHGGMYDGRKCAIKESLAPMNTSTQVYEYYDEVIKQNELFCHAHRAKLNQPKYTKIPKPLFIANMDKIPLLGMEPLDDSLYKFIKKNGTKNHSIDDRIKFTKIITDMFECLCNTLIYLQNKYEFYHRDMHCGNIMYRKNGESYEWFLIDFGFSTFKLNNYRFGEKCGPYSKFNTDVMKKGKAKGRVGHDLRLTLLFMFNLLDIQLEKMILPEAFDVLVAIYYKIETDIIMNAIGSSSTFWHRGYDDAFNKLVTKETEPKVFLAETVQTLQGIIKISNKSLYLTPPRSKTEPKKEFIFVERKEGALKI